MWAAATGLLLLATRGAEAAIVIDVSEEAPAPSIFSVYEQNEREGVPNYITEDLLLVTYSLIRVRVAKAIERERYLPQLERLVAGLREAVEKSAGKDAASRANRDFLAVLEALLAGRSEVTGGGDAKRAQAELDLVLAANEIAPSPLWGYRMDYGQFLPRGHYEGDEALTRYFRTMRYAGAALFAVKPSRATGVSRSLARRMAQQAEQLARSIDADAALSAARQALLANLAWRFGPAEDITLAAVLAVPPKPARSHAVRLFEYAKAEEMLPSILGGVVERSRLPKDLSALEALAGWRLLPQRRTVDYAAFQRLVYDGTGAFEGDAEAEETPFGLALIDGQAVKAFPLLDELMSLWGSDDASAALVKDGETAFAGYEEATVRAQHALAEATGLAALHQQLFQTGFAQPTSPERRTALRAFWTWQRYSALLYAKQSYTPAGKGLPASRHRGARIEPSLALYQSLARIVGGHRHTTPHPSWNAFAETLEKVIDVASRQSLLGHPTAEDEHFLNGLPAEIKQAAGGGDWPIVVDVHVDPGSGQVVQAATGLASVAARAVAGDASQRWAATTRIRGARFTQHEFKRPLAERLTDAKWRETLTQAVSAAGKVRGEAGHRALIVGVSVHAHASVGNLLGVLPGTRHDVVAMRDGAELLGFRARNIRTLQDEHATLAAFRRELQRLAQATYRDGDRVLIYFSGHGGQVPDDDSDEADGLDEVLVFHDARIVDGKVRGVLRDDELGNLVDAIPNDDVLVLIDTDHSAGLVDADGLTKPGHILLSAVAEDEITVAEAEGHLFTVAITDAIKAACVNGKLTADELRTAAAQGSRDHSIPSTPTLHGAPGMLTQNLFLPGSKCFHSRQGDDGK